MREQLMIWLTIGTLPLIMAVYAATHGEWGYASGFALLAVACLLVSGAKVVPRTFHARHATRRRFRQ